MARKIYRSNLRAPADFGLAIQQARMTRGMTQADLAADIGLSQSAVSEIESGKSTIYLRQLLSLARATGVELTATWYDDLASDAQLPDEGTHAIGS